MEEGGGAARRPREVRGDVRGGAGRNGAGRDGARLGFTDQLLAAQDDERRRIARELHDGTAATLVALSLDLTRLVESLPSGDARELAETCALLCEQSLRELRATAFVLHPPLLTREGLVSSLRWLADGFSKRSGILVTFEEDAATKVRLRPYVELTLYRIVQEALTNVLRHSGSRTARVTLATTDADVRLTISDEGTRGAERRRARVTDGVGLASMRERVRGLHGSFDVAFRRHGTVVTVVIPLG